MERFPIHALGRTSFALSYGSYNNTPFVQHKLCCHIMAATIEGSLSVCVRMLMQCDCKPTKTSALLAQLANGSAQRLHIKRTLREGKANDYLFQSPK